ncbi:hypothetical protein V6N11_053003 [Hibiscus sabdariffa]|uniref:Fe2OG dioxygenase domain-containing protein n=1 Tax=Hibiscus sabdariffa TaxID=183260 RepID=A0ABR2UBR6_9ROSI
MVMRFLIGGRDAVQSALEKLAGKQRQQIEKIDEADMESAAQNPRNPPTSKTTSKLLMTTIPTLGSSLTQHYHSLIVPTGIFSLPISNGDSSLNDLASYRRMASQRGTGLGKRGEQWTEVLSWEPRAFIYHNLLSREECEYLIKLAKPHMAKSTVVDSKTGKSKDSRVRTSSGMFLRRGQDKIIRDIEKRIADYTFIPTEHGEGLQVLHYEVGQKYDAHFDYFLDEFNTKNGGQRMATMLMYLSDVEEGGETIFPAAKGNISAVPWWNELSECGKQGLAVKPKMGDALLFWSMRPDATLDPSSLHATFRCNANLTVCHTGDSRWMPCDYGEQMVLYKVDACRRIQGLSLLCKRIPYVPCWVSDPIFFHLTSWVEKYFNFLMVLVLLSLVPLGNTLASRTSEKDLRGHRKWVAAVTCYLDCKVAKIIMDTNRIYSR